MMYSIIYSVDCPRSVSIRQFAPPKLRKLWDMTEGDEQYDFGHLEGDWAKGKHRKWCALLTQEQFDEFINKTCLCASDVETMGSLGSPGFGWGWSPAISFDYPDHDEAILNAYVTPVGTKSEIIEFLCEHEMDIPQILLDDDAQQFFWPEAIDHEAPWNAVRECVIADNA